MKVKLIRTRGQLAIGSVVDLSGQEAEDAIRSGEALDLATAEIVERQEAQIKAQDEANATRASAEADALINDGITKAVFAAKDTSTQAEWKKNLTGPLAHEYRLAM